MTSYDKGDLVRLTVAFTDLGGTAADPTTVTLSVRDPAGTITTYTYAGAQVIKEATGAFYYDLALSTVGVYTYRWTGTGAVQAATPDTALRVNSTIF